MTRTLEKTAVRPAPQTPLPGVLPRVPYSLFAETYYFYEAKKATPEGRIPLWFTLWAAAVVVFCLGYLVLFL